MRCSGWAAGTALLTASLLLADCRKPPAPAAQPNSSASAASPAATSAAPASQGLLPAQTVANSLLNGGFSAPPGYSIRQALSCNPPTAGEAWTLRCEAYLNDDQRGGEPAMAEIDLYDHDVTLQADDDRLKQHIASFPDTDSISTNPNVTETMAKTGQVVSIFTVCRQAVGSPNSPAYCIVQANPRVIIMSGVHPLHPYSRGGITFTMVDGQPKSSVSQDCDHASDLSLAVMSMLSDG